MRDKDPVQVVLDFLAAVRDERVDDVLALVDPEIICRPLVRPARAIYEGHDGMVCFVKDMHTVFGRYQVEVDKITAQSGPKVTVEARLLPQSGHRPRPSLPIVIEFTFRGGLITLAEGEPGTSMP